MTTHVIEVIAHITVHVPDGDPPPTITHLDASSDSPSADVAEVTILASTPRATQD